MQRSRHSESIVDAEYRQTSQNYEFLLKMQFSDFQQLKEEIFVLLTIGGDL